MCGALRASACLDRNRTRTCGALLGVRVGLCAATLRCRDRRHDEEEHHRDHRQERDQVVDEVGSPGRRNFLKSTSGLIPTLQCCCTSMSCSVTGSPGTLGHVRSVRFWCHPPAPKANSSGGSGSLTAMGRDRLAAAATLQRQQEHRASLAGRRQAPCDPPRRLRARSCLRTGRRAARRRAASRR